MNAGAIQYSNIISLKNEVQPAVKNLLIKSNGELSFILDGNSPGNYSFKLVSTDGKVLAQAKEFPYSPGLNTIRISKTPVLYNFVYLMVYNNNKETTTLLRVEK